ncbi:MAG: ATP-dependent Clp protease adaptor ClpS [Rhodoplanes sp.]
MDNGTIKPGRRTKIRTKTEKPRLYKVILLNDDYTPREFVVGVLKKVFGMSESSAHRLEHFHFSRTHILS